MVTDAMLVNTFCEAFEAVNGQVRRAENDQEAAEAIGEILRESGAKCVATADVPEALLAGIEAQCAQHGIELLKPPYQAADLPGAIDAAPVGITVAEFGIADSGTLVEISGNDATRLVSSLPRTHIGIVRASTLIPTLREATPRLRELFDHHLGGYAVSFISGPSRTGDIEMKLTLGVHGPEAAFAVILP